MVLTAHCKKGLSKLVCCPIWITLNKNKNLFSSNRLSTNMRNSGYKRGKTVGCFKDFFHGFTIDCMPSHTIACLD